MASLPVSHSFTSLLEAPWTDPYKAPKKQRRDLAALEKWEAIDHNRTDILDYSPATPESVIFAANTSCILSPTVTDGPYYVWGEVVRQNVKEDLYSDGVDVFLEVQYIDINTCKPVPGALVDIWQANATGVYRYVINRILDLATSAQ